MKPRTRKTLLFTNFVLICLLTIRYVILHKVPQQAIEKTNAPDTMAGKPILQYGIPVDSFDVINGTIQPDEFLSEILFQFNLHNVNLIRITDSIAKVFDIKSFRKGAHYSVFLSPDSMFLRYFVYEHTPLDYLFVKIADSSVEACMQQKEVRVEEKKANIVVQSSVWNSMRDQGCNPLLSLELSEIFAWTVDFFGLQKGDHFRVIYEERFVDSTSLGIDKVITASFDHNGNEIYAIPFEQDGRQAYFDQDGNSLRKAFLKAPLRYSRIASRFSASRMHPILHIRRSHFAIDYAAPAGTPVHSIGDGRVTEMGYHSGSGNIVKIKHNSVYSSAYLHFSAFAKGLKTGTIVQQGELIGYVGSTGLSTGPHLDFRIYKNGVPVDPLKIEAPSVEPVNKERRGAFDSVKTECIQRLTFENFVIAKY